MMLQYSLQVGINYEQKRIISSHRFIYYQHLKTRSLNKNRQRNCSLFSLKITNHNE